MQKAVQARGIRCVVHFTRLCNLGRILSEGLKSRNDLEQGVGECTFSDNIRVDGHTGAICLSISFPNYKMFYRLRCDNPQDKWVILLLKPSVLWKKDCAFFKTNAASNHCRFLDVASRKGEDSFLDLFDEQSKEIQHTEGTTLSVDVRSHYELPTNYTTDPQAEVLCFDHIDISYIMKIFFHTDADKQSIINVPSHIICETEPRAFGCRKDYLAWR